MKPRLTFRRIFATGALLVMPTLVTLFLLNFALDKVDANFTPWFLQIFKTLDVDKNGVPDTQAWQVFVPLLGMAVFLGTIFLVGLIGSHYVGKRIIHVLERTILRVPLISTIYGSTKQLFDAFNVQHGESFSRVVLVEYPRRGMHALAFVTKQVHPKVQARTGRDDLVFVFVPTTPNPTSGFLLALPEDELCDTGLSIEAGLKTVFSGGMVTLGPDDLPEAPRELTGESAPNDAAKDDALTGARPRGAA